MKIARRHTDTGPTLSVLAPGDELVDLVGESDLVPLLADEDRLRDAAEQALASRRSVTAVADAALLAPLVPPTFRDFSTFPAHTEGVVKLLDPAGGIPDEFWQIPTFYFSNPYAITGPFADVPITPGCVDFDFELEVGAVIGTAGHDLTVEQAAAHIAGYVVINDFSARDVQFHEMRMRLGPAKGKDTATSLGQYFVTADELSARASGPSFDLRMHVEVNGEKVGEDTLDHMAWTFPALAAYASRGTQIRPGDLLGSGTCRNGCLAELWGRNGRDSRPELRPGDVVTTTVDILGGTRNRIVESADAHTISPWRSS
ncbi:2-keto-4-pentenoate hydratase/2-oxohepta-3-ene-1,7-dioic acid hydratase in catechol pathway [Rhodococcus erythropolis]|uniref:fumarylacetoacetate hydrolase family protein n=1 Tax=Rhodococcus erythropolis TaxID=1833 RepID=UPI00216A755D|nr:fumarylacetoacetate hydrolase family protein [Rhodococcus erythropolis]MCS4257819.1 2-keto-4-pentenoate hydratase/2-oxohepta-3-ene-1,7-dioic acid hydratase in catechol pathway [Rhodococcus erythropolis]MCW2425120.1 2-keto-4-pentenoate hydratase/2-oxohepta-3-ene-1,7-dioic acid hydratase in catechol pathway [Rhodococcus erythropolis]